jgi:hypothetical protein
MNAQEIISAIREAGAKESQSILDALCDGAALLAMGVTTDDDQDAVEEALEIVKGQRVVNQALSITATTSDIELEDIPYNDMRREARERRDDAAAVLEEQGDQQVLEYVEYGDGVAVLYSPAWGYAYVNKRSNGVGDSILIEQGNADSADHAAHIWREANAG